MDTDLPDDTVISLSVYRTYYENDAKTAYARDYFSEKSTVAEWRKAHRIPIDNSKWLEALRKHQKELARAGEPFRIASISDDIEASIVVPTFQENPRFGGPLSPKLRVKAVTVDKNKKAARSIRVEVAIPDPLSPSHKADKPTPSLDPNALDRGVTYIVSKDTPLMPEHSPKDPLEAIRRSKSIPAGGS
ncbi:MAG: hypothetical protein JNG90_06650, partial [Planctomycetaceae bacterium]|nr:hypothetical protein [Planctomycetaceae bacterium]